MEQEKEICYDFVIVGSGPAAYSAALYLAEKGYKNIVMYLGGFSNGIGPGGQLTITTAVDNYPGFPKGTVGPDMMDYMNSQWVDKGLKAYELFVNSISQNVDGKFSLTIADATEILSKAVILGTGASARILKEQGVDKYWQHGISACAVCDGYFYFGGDVAVIGGGDTAITEALHLARICKNVHLIHRRDKFRAKCDLVDKAKACKNITFHTPFKLNSCCGDNKKLQYILCESNNGEELKLEVSGLFFAIGHIPNTGCVKELGVTFYENGYIKSDSFMKTDIEGLFVCGDVQDFEYRQAVTAASSGIVSAISGIKYLK